MWCPAVWAVAAGHRVGFVLQYVVNRKSTEVRCAYVVIYYSQKVL